MSFSCMQRIEPVHYIIILYYSALYFCLKSNGFSNDSREQNTELKMLRR